MTTSLQRLASAIGYPDALPDAPVATLRADSLSIVAEALPRDRIRLSFPIPAKPERLPDAAAFAAGRLLREDAVLAFGPLPSAENPEPVLFLWQETADLSPAALVRFFETFLDSCDWWRERLADAPSASSSPEFPQMVILP